MTTGLPPLIECYFAGKNELDFATAMSAFSQEAVVQDESHTYKGKAAIRAWMEATSKKYNDTAEVKMVEADGEHVKVTATVSGTFPGSPIALQFRFRLDGALIDRLEIAA